MEECSFEVVHQYKFSVLGQDVRKFYSGRGVLHYLNIYIWEEGGPWIAWEGYECGIKIDTCLKISAVDLDVSVRG